MRILVVKTSSLGDLFHALPAVRLLKRGLDDARVDWVANAEYAALAERFEDVSRVLPFPRRDLRRGWGAFRAALRADAYDLVVDFQGLMKSALIARSARRAPGARILGPSFRREGAGWLYSAVVGKKDKERHAVEENLDVPRFLGLPTSPVEFPVRFPAPEDSGLPPSYVVFSPRSRHAAKNWPPERFAELGRNLGCPVVLTGAPSDAETCARIAAEVPGAIDRCGKTDLVGLGSILQGARLVVTVDSGPMHVAAACGTRCLALFGPTDPKRVGPYGPRHRVLRGATPARYDKSDMQSIRRIGVEEALAAARELIEAEGG